MTDEAIVAKCEKNTFLISAREAFRQRVEGILTKLDGHYSPSDEGAILKRMEFEAVAEIAACLGLRLAVVPKPKPKSMEDLL